MLARISLRSRIFFLLSALIVTNLAGAWITLWYANRTQSLYTSMVDRDVTALLAAQKLLTALVMQKGFTTYYFLSEEPQWLERLEEHHRSFQQWLKKARDSTYLEDARKVLNEIESNYLAYTHSRDQVIRFYQEGKREAGARRHWGVRDQFHAIYALCERYRQIHEESIVRTKKSYSRAAKVLTVLAWSAIPGGILMGVLLAYVLFGQVLKPIRELALSPGVESSEARRLAGDEVEALGRRVRSLMDDVYQAHSQLEESREHLIQSEKLALVGKLAAGVAHSIRNPLTSVKMRLFSLERTLELNPTQKEDLEVISEEIRHIDTIVRSFLEFSRPPKLKLQWVSPSDVVDMSLQLMKHRIESYGVEVRVARRERFPKIMVDAEQLKEALVNLLLNSCEAMRDGGAIEIREEKGEVKPWGDALILRVSDNGPGIPESLRDKVFQPFFSTKEEGSGLGLSIVRRILLEHGGRVELWSKEGEGTTFALMIPVRRNCVG